MSAEPQAEQSGPTERYAHFESVHPVYGPSIFEGQYGKDWWYATDPPKSGPTAVGTAQPSALDAVDLDCDCTPRLYDECFVDALLADRDEMARQVIAGEAALAALRGQLAEARELAEYAEGAHGYGRSDVDATRKALLALLAALDPSGQRGGAA